MISKIFRKIAIIKWPFLWKLQKSYAGWIRKTLGLHPSYRFSDFPSKIENLGSKLIFFNFWEFSLFFTIRVIWLDLIICIRTWILICADCICCYLLKTLSSGSNLNNWCCKIQTLSTLGIFRNFWVVGLILV